MIENIIKWVIGDVNKITLEERLLNGASFIMSCGSLLFVIHVGVLWGAGFNLLFMALACLIYLAIFYSSRFRRLEQSAFVFAFLFPILMSAGFILFGGIDADMEAAIVISFLVGIRILPKKFERIYFLFISINWGVLILLGYYSPDLVYILTTRAARHIDSFVTMIICLFFSWSVIRIFKQNNQMEKQAIQDKNKELTEFQEQLVKEKERAEHLSSVKTEFLSTMSHELRTPLNGVIGITNLMLRDDDERIKLENLEILKFSAENLVTIVNDILDYNKIEEGKISFEHISFEMHKQLELAVSTYSAKARENKVELKLDIARDLPQNFKGDSTRLSQILNNLISNAVKFTQNGEVTVHVSCEKQNAQKTRVFFRVIDTGIGIPEKNLETIFDRFMQADNSTTRNYGGTGLGLAISKRLVNLQNGKMGVKSIEGKGSEFFFWIDYESSSETKYIAPATSDKPNFSGIKVLLVEDNQINIMVANTLLEKWGAHVTIAKDGVEALECYHKSEFDIVLMDIHMPRLDGFETTIRIRNTNDDKTPILALTATVAPGIQERIREVGMNDYVLKPFQPDDLKEKMQALLPA